MIYNPYKGVVCPACGSDCTKVQQTAPANGRTLRRRVCACGYRFVSQEIACENNDLYNEWVRECKVALKEHEKEHGPIQRRKRAKPRVPQQPRDWFSV